MNAVTNPHINYGLAAFNSGAVPAQPPHKWPEDANRSSSLYESNSFWLSFTMAGTVIMGMIGWDFLQDFYLRVFQHDGSEFNRQTGMLTVARRFRAPFTAPFYEFDATMEFRHGAHGDSGMAVWLHHRYSSFEVFLGAKLQSLGMTREECLAFWDTLQRYMDVSQPLPELQILEQFRHLDPTTAAHDKLTKRPPRCWRDLDYQVWERTERSAMMFGALTKAMEKNTIVPTLMVGFAIYNLLVHLDAEGSSARGMAGFASGSLDLLAALGSHSKLLLGPATHKFLSEPRISVERVPGNWTEKLNEQTGSRKLPLLRSIGGLATFAGSGLSAWDSYRAFGQGDTDAAVAYSVAAAGSSLWGASAIGWIINPYALIIGVTLSIGGTIAANLLTDSDLEIVVKKGPFGNQFAKTGVVDDALGNGNRFVHLTNPQTAYQQLVGILEKPQIFVQRLSDWKKNAPETHRNALKQADVKRAPQLEPNQQCISSEKQPLIDEDWIIVLSSPLLAMFENDVKFQLIAQEFLSRVMIDGTYNIKNYDRAPAAAPKLSAISLDASSVLYALPASLSSSKFNSGTRGTHGLKVSAQFELNPNQPSERLILPQPSPKNWSAFTAANSRIPPDNLQPDAAPPYWQIETTEFPS